jgi:hypothetical protein
MSNRALCVFGLILMVLACVNYFLNVDAMNENIETRLKSARCEQTQTMCETNGLAAELCDFMLAMNACEKEVK